MIKRSDKKLFYGVPNGDGEITFARAKYFTEASVSKNPGEYTRQYIDESEERTDVVRYSPSISYAFDEYKGDPVIEDIIKISDGELLGTDARRELVQVDFSSPVDGGFKAVKRTFAVIADSEGGSADAYTYGGTFKAVSKKTVGVATIVTPVDGDADNVETIEFTEGE